MVSVVSLSKQGTLVSASYFVVAITITEMGDAQANVPEDIFVNPAGPRLSAADMGERLKKEIAEAKKRKKGSSTAAKSEQEVATQRKELYKKLAPHFIGEVGIPVTWLKPPLAGFANRDFYDDHMWAIQGAMESSGVSYPWKPVLLREKRKQRK